jgi:hypothetical protein
LAGRQVALDKAGTGVERSKEERRALAPPLLAEEQVLDDLADQMDGQDVHLLYPLGVRGRDDETAAGKLSERTAVPAEDGERVHNEAGGSAERPAAVTTLPSTTMAAAGSWNTALRPRTRMAGSAFPHFIPSNRTLGRVQAPFTSPSTS